MEKKSIEKGKMTLEKLARMVANGFVDMEKRFENLEKSSEALKADTEKNFIKVRSDILGLDDRFIPRHEFEMRIKVVNSQIDRQSERISNLAGKR